MKLKSVFYLWLILLAPLCFEFIAVEFNSKYSLVLYLQSRFGLWPNKVISTQVGKSLSVVLGWIGIGFILMTNIYIIRKKAGFMAKWGKLKNWFSFHLLCGLLGPTFIIMHSNFKIGGLVAISFWSMMIVAISGILGSYFYVQVVRQESELLKEVEHWEKTLVKMRDKKAPQIADDALNEIKMNALVYAGVSTEWADTNVLSLPIVLLRTTISDLKLLFNDPKTLPGMPWQSRIALGRYAEAKRKIYLLKPFQTMLGHWHTFHVPFTIVMYVAAAIHITVALLFQV